MSVWFEGSNSISCDIQHVKNAFENPGEHYVGVVGHMPILSTVELVEAGDDFVTIKTNEGLMKRTKLLIQVTSDSVTVEFDEEYQAGSMVTAKSHYLDTFTTIENGVSHSVVLSNVTASGLLGFFYRVFAKNSTGNAHLKSYKKFLER